MNSADALDPTVTRDQDLINFRAAVPGRVYRGAAPYGYDAEQAGEFLARHGINTVIDLRTQGETALASWPQLPAGIELVHAPIDGEASPLKSADLRAPEDLGRMYLALLDECHEQAVRVVTPVAQGRVVLLHCSAGKDRTGITSALLQSVAGWDDEAIIADYATTQANMGDVTRAMAAAYGKYVGDLDQMAAQSVPPVILTAPAVAMRVFLDGVRERYADAETYLRQAGLSDELVQQLKLRLRG